MSKATCTVATCPRHPKYFEGVCSAGPTFVVAKVECLELPERPYVFLGPHLLQFPGVGLREPCLGYQKACEENAAEQKGEDHADAEAQ